MIIIPSQELIIFSFAEKSPQKTEFGESILRSSVRFESEADQVGMFQAYMAGFDPESVTDALFDSLYGAYELDDALPGYPSREIRKMQTHTNATDVRPLAYLFWSGQALFCRGFFDEAGSCYNKILTTSANRKIYNFKEIYNNLGLTQLQQALTYSPNKEVREFALPMELDAQNRLLMQHSRTGTETQNLLTDEILAEADKSFGKAIALDPNYKMAYLNRAAVWIMRGNYHMALGHLNEMTKQFPKNLPPEWWTIYGLAQFGLKKIPAAKQAFINASRKSAIAMHNLKVLQAIEHGDEKPLQIRGAKVVGCEAKQSLFKEVSPASFPNELRMTTLLKQSTPGPYLSVDWANNNKQDFLKITLKGPTLLFASPSRF